MSFYSEVRALRKHIEKTIDGWLQRTAVRSSRWLPPRLFHPVLWPAGPAGRLGLRPPRDLRGPLLMRGGGGAMEGEQKGDLETALKFVLTMKRQCALYLYSTTKAIEFPSMGAPNIICDDETEIHKYTDSIENLFYATFNTFSELLSRDAVHRRVGMRMSSEEYVDLNMFDRVHKLIRFIMLVFQVLCSAQSAFKNVAIPARLEAHVLG